MAGAPLAVNSTMASHNLMMFSTILLNGLSGEFGVYGETEVSTRPPVRICQAVHGSVRPNSDLFHNLASRHAGIDRSCIRRRPVSDAQ